MILKPENLIPVPTEEFHLDEQGGMRQRFRDTVKKM